MNFGGDGGEMLISNQADTAAVWQPFVQQLSGPTEFARCMTHGLPWWRNAYTLLRDSEILIGTPRSNLSVLTMLAISFVAMFVALLVYPDVQISYTWWAICHVGRVGLVLVFRGLLHVVFHRRQRGGSSPPLLTNFSAWIEQRIGAKHIKLVLVWLNMVGLLSYTLGLFIYWVVLGVITQISSKGSSFFVVWSSLAPVIAFAYSVTQICTVMACYRLFKMQGVQGANQLEPVDNPFEAFGEYQPANSVAHTNDPEAGLAADLVLIARYEENFKKAKEAADLRSLQDQEYREALASDKLTSNPYDTYDEHPTPNTLPSNGAHTAREQTPPQKTQQELEEEEWVLLKNAILSTLPPEPPSGPGIITIRVKLPYDSETSSAGVEIQRKFSVDDKVDLLAVWVAAYMDGNPDPDYVSWRVVQTNPRLVLDPRDNGVREATLKEKGLVYNAKLFVEKADEGSDEDMGSERGSASSATRPSGDL